MMPFFRKQVPIIRGKKGKRAVIRERVGGVQPPKSRPSAERSELEWRLPSEVPTESALPAPRFALRAGTKKDLAPVKGPGLDDRIIPIETA